MTEFAPHYAEAKSAGWWSGKRLAEKERRKEKPNWLVGVVARDIVIREGRVGFRRDVGDASHPPTIFKHVFDEYSSSIISNLFDNNKSYALSTRNTAENVRTKCIIFGKHSDLGAKIFKQNLPKNYSKSAKMATTVFKFSKIFRESMPPEPPKAFLFSVCFKMILHEKNTLENMANLGVPPPP